LDDYIIGPLYKNKRGRPADLQIGVTGGIAVQEPAWIAASRELGEETGLVPYSKTDLKSVLTGTYSTKRGYKQMKVYNLYVGDAIPVREHQHGAKVTSREDHKTAKVGCLAFGTLARVKAFLSKRKIYIYHSNDNIMGVGAFKVSDIVALMEAGEV
jgi:hypothetical protein